MPLLDHFHPPLAAARNWESFHALWAAALVEELNEELLPGNYFAETQLVIGGRVEVDVATLEQQGPGQGNGLGLALATWAPPRATGSMPGFFPDEIEVRILETGGGPTLVGAIELVSPANKDRPESRRAFAIKCASYLQLGVGVMVVDVVTNRLANLHDELISLLGFGPDKQFPDRPGLYAAAYHPVRPQPQESRVDYWLVRLTLGQDLPTMAMCLRNGPVLPLDLDKTYLEARRIGRL